MSLRHKQAIDTFPAGIQAFVTAHIDYTTYSFAALRMLREGGFILYHRALANTRLNVFRSREHLDQIADNTMFDRFVANGNSIDGHEGDGDGTRDITQAAYAVKDPVYDASIRSYVERSGKLCVSLFAHAPTDSIRLFGGMLYPTYLDWVNATLECAAKQLVFTWLVKQHPAGRDYDSTNAFEALKTRFGRCEHIRFVSDAASTGTLRDVTDGLITVRGAIGYEYARYGIPVLCAGNSRYRTAGFAITPASVQEYEWLLHSGCWLGRLNPEATRNADQFWRFEEFAGRNRSSVRVYDRNYYAGTDAYWQAAVDRLQAAAGSTDPLETAIRGCIESGRSMVTPVS